MPSCHPKTEHALCSNTVIFRLPLGLYFSCNATQNRQSVSQWTHLRISWPCDLDLVWIWIFPIFITVWYGWERLSRTLRPQVPQVMTAPACCSRLAPWLMVVEGQKSICHFWYPLKKFILRARWLKSANLSVWHTSVGLSGEGRVLRVHLTCHEFEVRIWTDGMWQEWLRRTGGPVIMSCVQRGRICLHVRCVSVRIRGRAEWLRAGGELSGSWQWHHCVVPDIIRSSKGWRVNDSTATPLAPSRLYSARLDSVLVLFHNNCYDDPTSARVGSS